MQIDAAAEQINAYTLPTTLMGPLPYSGNFV